MVIIVVEFKLIWLPLGSVLVYFHEGDSCLENTTYFSGDGSFQSRHPEVLMEK